MLFLHFNDRAFQLGKEIENLSCLRRPFLFGHPLVEGDLFLIFQ